MIRPLTLHQPEGLKTVENLKNTTLLCSNMDPSMLYSIGQFSITKINSSTGRVYSRKLFEHMLHIGGEWEICERYAHSINNTVCMLPNDLIACCVSKVREVSASKEWGVIDYDSNLFTPFQNGVNKAPVPEASRCYFRAPYFFIIYINSGVVKVHRYDVTDDSSFGLMVFEDMNYLLDMDLIHSFQIIGITPNGDGFVVVSLFQQSKAFDGIYVIDFDDCSVQPVEFSDGCEFPPWSDGCGHSVQQGNKILIAFKTEFGRSGTQVWQLTCDVEKQGVDELGFFSRTIANVGIWTWKLVVNNLPMAARQLLVVPLLDMATIACWPGSKPTLHLFEWTTATASLQSIAWSAVLSFCDRSRVEWHGELLEAGIPPVLREQLAYYK